MFCDDTLQHEKGYLSICGLEFVRILDRIIHRLSRQEQNEIYLIHSTSLHRQRYERMVLIDHIKINLTNCYIIQILIAKPRIKIKT
jgi:hypothetical protein